MEERRSPSTGMPALYAEEERKVKKKGKATSRAAST